MYLVFETEAEAEAAQAAIWQAIKPPHEIRAGEPVDDRVTQRWAVPRLAAGGWAIPVPDAPFGDVGGQEFAQVTFAEEEQ